MYLPGEATKNYDSNVIKKNVWVPLAPAMPQITGTERNFGLITFYGLRRGL
jgi:hypothetical protein